MKIIEESIEKYSNADKSGCPGRPNSTLNPLRLIAHHFPSDIPRNSVKREPRRLCAVCCSRKDANGKKIRKETRIWCKDWEVGLCLEPCFELYLLNCISEVFFSQCFMYTIVNYVLIKN